jgi:DNA-binding XRE family transcriptional regulator
MTREVHPLVDSARMVRLRYRIPQKVAAEDIGCCRQRLCEIERGTKGVSDGLALRYDRWATVETLKHL